MKAEHGRILLQVILPVVCLAIVVSLIVFGGLTKIKLESATHNKDDMKAVAEQYAEKVNDNLKIVETAGRTVSDVLADKDIIIKEDVQAASESLVENTSVYEVIYNQGEGTGIDCTGRVVDLTRLSYYHLLDIKSDMSCLYLEDDEIAGQEAILFIFTLRQNPVRNLLVYYPTDEIKSIIKMDYEFDTSAFTALVNEDGEILICEDNESAFLIGDNLWKNIDGEYANEIAKTKAQVVKQDSGYLSVTAEGEKRTLLYAPVAYDEWALVIGVEQEYVEMKENEDWETVESLLHRLFSAIIIFSLAVIAINIADRKRNAENDRRLEKRVDTDLLTGLNNKLATERKIKAYIEENPNELAMMFVLDIDNFKKINDTMGHAFGDEVLRELGRQIGFIFRATDIIGRTGGDEFTIFLKFLQDDANTLKEAQKIVNFFEGFSVGEYVKYSATASIGAAVFPAHGADFESLYKAADKALYKAKQRGKNQLAFYDDRDREAEKM